MKDLVSVIIPTYNAEKTIIECLESVRKQTYTKIEVIVINDGSRDNTSKILNNYKIINKSFPLIIYDIENSGPGTARNWGIKHSHGEYIAFLDSDDRWLPTKIEKQIRYLQNNPKIDLLSCQSIHNSINHTNKKEGIQIIRKWKILFKNYFFTSSTILKSTIIQNDLLFIEGRKYSEDYYLWLNIAFNNYTCAIMHESLTIQNNKPLYGHSGLSSRIWEMEKGELNNFKLLYSNSKISLNLFILASAFSILKFIKRIIITYIRKTIK